VSLLAAAGISLCRLPQTSPKRCIIHIEARQQRCDPANGGDDPLLAPRTV